MSTSYVDTSHLNNTTYELIFSQWSAEVRQSCAVLRQRAHACQSCPVGGPDGNDRQGSLVISFGGVSTSSSTSSSSPNSLDNNGGGGGASDVRVLWVHWVDSSRKVGKPFTLDTDGGIVYTPNFIKNEEQFHHIIHPAIGATMRRSRTYRERVSAEMLRLKAMCEAAFAPPTTGFEGDDEHCFICSLVFDDEPQALSTTGSDFKCMICLLHSHRKCCESVLRFLDGSGGCPTSSDAPGLRDLRKFEATEFTLDMVPSILLQSPLKRSEPQASSFNASKFEQPSSTSFAVQLLVVRVVRYN